MFYKLISDLCYYNIHMCTYGFVKKNGTIIIYVKINNPSYRITKRYREVVNLRKTPQSRYVT